VFPVSALGQSYSRSIDGSYRLLPNVTYINSGVWEGKLDIYSRADATNPRPTLIWIHGGSVVAGSKESATLSLLPYLEWGWNVVNVEHRLTGVTLAPTALANSLCAVRWIIRNAKEHGFDTNRLVISGSSSGGWFAVAAGLGVRPQGWQDGCPGAEEPKVTAIVNWYGNWDLADVLAGPNRKPYAAGWVLNLPDPLGIARSLLPLPIRPSAVRGVISIHGDADPTVPYAQSVRLHEALRNAGVAETLVTIPEGKHGGFPRSENQRAFAAIQAFLTKLDIDAK
jgi:acetyl esterase/lipase